ncbi:L-carnitine dehydratase/bile acid-inducible protein F [Rubrobacter xylanophilus DSM 9941]|uniref:L-carnitine dehydratase/bile acid-inducible protein F n=1 Tax=Rubrobacter xylanophilus (strain DSM 9941 / JCM 11954 / NBRC 16129 / PRD-1) TaxID=266117 RepID=Q1ATF1_RUBXD|nr:CoA transferase [Rubrobacter xylanophilus]ABG05327.1 L-carnitine dehydratase/bile acid-inducible protein F [Rubrobacter xylanophilus DSM 9941]
MREAAFGLPLRGLRVLDLSRVLAGPYATTVLGDLGADVIKVEHPERGDDTRSWGPPFAGGESAYFLSANRNKRSVALDLKTPEGLKKARELAAGADVLVENMRRGALERLGLGYAALRERNPGLIYCSITGFGPGPDQGRPGYDFLVQARAGIMGITGWPGGPPTKVGVAVADVVCGLYAAVAVLAALRRRSETGEGARIEVPLFESALSWLANRAQEYLVSGVDTGRLGNDHPTIVPYRTFEASDKTFAVAVGNDAQFARLCRAIGREDLAEDGRFADNPGRVANREELVAELQKTFSGRTAAEWVQRIGEAGVPCGPVSSLAEVFSDPHVLGCGILREVDHPAAGALRMLASPLLVDGERPPIRRPPPTLGEHTDGAGWEAAPDGPG